MSQTPANRDRYPVFFALATRWQDNDVYGHLNNVVYYELLDTVVNRHLIAQGVLGVHVQVPRKVGRHEQKVAEFLVDFFLR